MNQRIEQALQNVTIIVRQARMTAEEHEQLAKDIQLIRDNIKAENQEKD